MKTESVDLIALISCHIFFSSFCFVPMQTLKASWSSPQLSMFRQGLALKQRLNHNQAWRVKFLPNLRLCSKLSTYDFAQGSAYQLVSFREVLPICGTLPLIWFSHLRRFQQIVIWLQWSACCSTSCSPHRDYIRNGTLGAMLWLEK